MASHLRLFVARHVLEELFERVTRALDMATMNDLRPHHRRTLLPRACTRAPSKADA
jgi:hypothetical protein